MTMNRANLALLLPLLFTGGCGHGHDHDHAAEGGHEHAAVHEGAVMVEIGDHFAQLEARVDPEAGVLELWFWDHENAVRLADESLAVEVTVGDVTGVVICAAQASALTGETVGDSSEFRGESELLVGAERVSGVVLGATVRGTAFERIEFTWPGAESDE